MLQEFQDQSAIAPTPPALPPSAAAINADLAKLGLIAGSSMLGAIAARLIPGLAVPYGLILTASMLGTLARASSAEEKGDRVLGAIIGGAIALGASLGLWDALQGLLIGQMSQIPGLLFAIASLGLTYLLIDVATAKKQPPAAPKDSEALEAEPWNP